jgi:hypothetical protein
MNIMARCLILLLVTLRIAVPFSLPAPVLGAEVSEEWCPEEPSAGQPGILEGGAGTAGNQEPLDSALSLPACGAGEVRDSTGACVCPPAQEMVAGACTPACNAGEIREEATGKCVCAEAYERIGDQCLARCSDDQERMNGLCASRCGANEERNAQGICVCREGFESVGGLCYRRCGSNEHHDDKGDCICDEGFERVGSLCLVQCGADETRGPGGECTCLSGYERLEDGRCVSRKKESSFSAEEEVSGEQAEEAASGSSGSGPSTSKAPESGPAASKPSGPKPRPSREPDFRAEEEVQGEEAEKKATPSAPPGNRRFTTGERGAPETPGGRARPSPSSPGVREGGSEPLRQGRVSPPPIPKAREDAGREKSAWEKFMGGFERGLREGSLGGAGGGERRRADDTGKPPSRGPAGRQPSSPFPRQPQGTSPQTGNWQALWAGQWRGSGSITATDIGSRTSKTVRVTTTVIIQAGQERGGIGTLHAQITMAGKDETTGVMQRDSVEGALEVNVRNPNAAMLDKTISVEGQTASTKAVLRLEGGVMRGDIRQSVDGGASTARITFTANRASR